MNFENILNKYKEMTNSGQFTDSIFSETLVQLINKPETNIETSEAEKSIISDYKRCKHGKECSKHGRKYLKKSNSIMSFLGLDSFMGGSSVSSKTRSRKPVTSVNKSITDEWLLSVSDSDFNNMITKKLIPESYVQKRKDLKNNVSRSKSVSKSPSKIPAHANVSSLKSSSSSPVSNSSAKLVSNVSSSSKKVPPVNNISKSLFNMIFLSTIMTKNPVIDFVSKFNKS